MFFLFYCKINTMLHCYSVIILTRLDYSFSPIYLLPLATSFVSPFQRPLATSLRCKYTTWDNRCEMIFSQKMLNF